MNPLKLPPTLQTYSSQTITPRRLSKRQCALTARCGISSRNTLAICSASRWLWFLGFNYSRTRKTSSVCMPVFSLHSTTSKNSNSNFPSADAGAGFDWLKLPQDSLIVDVGGGNGSESYEIAKKAPHVNIVVQDRDKTIQEVAIPVRCYVPTFILTMIHGLSSHLTLLYRTDLEQRSGQT